jgi:predicted transcriptional regulator
MSGMIAENNLLDLTTSIVAAHMAHNTVSIKAVPAFIKEIHQTLADLSPSKAVAQVVSKPTVREKTPEVVAPMAATAAPVDPSKPKPAVDPKNSIFKDHLICLNDGKEMKMLRRHLRTHFKISPEQYREMWGLDANYPMVAPNYSKLRSKLAKKAGLGTKV